MTYIDNIDQYSNISYIYFTCICNEKIPFNFLSKRIFLNHNGYMEFFNRCFVYKHKLKKKRQISIVSSITKWCFNFIHSIKNLFFIYHFLIFEELILNEKVFY